MPQCQAKSKHSGEQCRRMAMKGMRVCYMHGGKSATKGIASPTYKHGRYSKYMPARLIEKYDEARGDPELIALRDELAVLDTRLNDLLARVDTGESGQVWGEAVKAWDEFKAVQTTRDQDKIRLAAAKVERYLRDGLTDYAAWAEIENVINLRRRVAAEERRRLVDLKQAMTYEQMATVYAALGEAIRRKVKDRVVLSEIMDEFGRILGVGTA